jgi:hypothetical protein
MTVQNTANFVDYVGDDATLVFNFTFRVDDVAWLSVDFVDDFDQFNINLDQDLNPGGNATYLVAPPSPGMGGPDPSFRVIRTTPQSQLLAYTRYDPFDSLSHEAALDRLTMQTQDISTVISSGDSFLQLQVDANLLLITTGLSPGHQHSVADLIDYGNHADPTVDENITGQWDFVNAGGIRVFDAGFVNGAQLSVQTGFMEMLALGAVTGFRSNGALQVTELGVVANSLTISHDGVDGQIVGANMGDLNISGITGRLIQGAEVYAYQSDIVAAGLLPPPVVGQILFSDGAGWLGTTAMLWDEVNASLTFDNSPGVGTPSLIFNNVDPSGVIMQIGGVGSGSTNWDIFRSFDNSGGLTWALRDDHGLSSPNHRLQFLNGAGSKFIELDNSDEMRLMGGESFEQMYLTASGTVAIRNGATLYLEETTVNGQIAGHGQIWTDTSQGLNFTDSAGLTTDLLGGGGGIAPGTVTNATLRWSGAAWVESTNILHIEAGANTVEIRGSGAFLQLHTTGAAVDEKETRIKMDNFAGFAIQSVSDGGFNGPFLMGANRTGDAWQDLEISTDVHVFGFSLMDYIVLNERSLSPAATATEGTFWVLDTSPNVPMWQNDIDQNYNIAILSEYRYEFDTSVAAGNPGNGLFRLNSATAANVTAIYIENVVNSTFGLQDQIYSQLHAGDVITIYQTGVPGNFQRFRLNGDPIDNTGWHTIPVTTLSGADGTTWAAAADVRFQFDFNDKAFSGLSAAVANPASFTLGVDAARETSVKNDTVAITITCAASGVLLFPIGASHDVYNRGASNDITIADGGETLIFLDGATATDVGANMTVGPGGAVTIYRESASVYLVTGIGATP